MVSLLSGANGLYQLAITDQLLLLDLRQNGCQLSLNEFVLFVYFTIIDLQ
jgi:hypothetical protein